MELLKRNVLDLGGDVDEGMVRYAREALIRLFAKGSPEITILITSGGGGVGIGLDIYDLLSGYPGKKNGIIYGYAKSMAAVILQACNQRRAARHASILIHHISRRSISLDILRDEARIKETLEEMEKDQARLYKILSDRTKKDVGIIRAECAKEKDMSAEEALLFGLIDEITDSSLISPPRK